MKFITFPHVRNKIFFYNVMKIAYSCEQVPKLASAAESFFKMGVERKRFRPTVIYFSYLVILRFLSFLLQFAIILMGYGNFSFDRGLIYCF